MMDSLDEPSSNQVNSSKENLWRAALNDDAEKIKTSDADINAKTPLGYTALHIAASGGCLNAVEALLTRGADIDCLDKDGLTPLYRAVKGNKTEVALLLLNRGADTSIVDSEKTSLLHNAALNGMAVIIPHLLISVDPLTTDDSGKLPLHMSCEGGDLASVRLLLDCDNSQVNCGEDSSNYTPLHEAAFWGQKAVVRFLLDRGASINALTATNETPLQLAKACGHTYVCEFLRSKGGIIGGKL